MLLTIISIVVLIGLDQLTKYWATIALAPDKAAPFLPGIMELRYTRNEGAAFSMLADKEWGRWFLIGVTSIALAVVLYLILTKTLSTSKLCQAALVLIFAGGVGNLVDRSEPVMSSISLRPPLSTLPSSMLRTALSPSGLRC